jgi:hypothetical protein
VAFFGGIGAGLPSFLHVLALSLLTATGVTSRTARANPSIEGKRGSQSAIPGDYNDDRAIPAA